MPHISSGSHWEVEVTVLPLLKCLGPRTVPYFTWMLRGWQVDRGHICWRAGGTGGEAAGVGGSGGSQCHHPLH